MQTIISALALLLLSDLAVAVEPGVYYCVTERMVGIQLEFVGARLWHQAIA